MFVACVLQTTHRKGHKFETVTLIPSSSTHQESSPQNLGTLAAIYREFLSNI